MIKLAVAQLGSNVLDQNEFADKLCIATVQRLLPAVIAVANLPSASALTADCLAVKTKKEARIAACAVRKAVYAAAAAAADADADAAAAAASAKYAAVYAAADAAADAAAAAAREKMLLLAADICLQVLIDMKSPGCDYLHLCDKAA
jgi:hypothetical protein